MLRRVALSSRSVVPYSALNTAVRFCLQIPVPFIAESINVGKVGEWTKRVGDSVEVDDVVCQIESDKLTVDVRAPKAGVITAIMSNSGATVNIGQPIATLKEFAAGEKPPPKAATPPPASAAAAPAQPTAQAQTPAAPPAATKAAAPAAASTISAPSFITGSDPRCRLVEASSMRQRIADRLKASQNTAAMLTTFNEIDMTPLMQLREKYKDAFFKKHEVKLGFMSPFAKACAIALTDVPIVNSSYKVVGDKTVVEYHDFVDISVAVATPKGLVVPVLRDVQDMNLAQIEKAIEDFGARAKVNKLSPAEMTGGTFTISNGGTFGSWMGTPIINPPQSAILGMHAVKKKPWVMENNTIAVRDIMAVALTYDHRVIDGRDAVTFLVKVKNLIEDPARMILDLA